MGINMNIEEVYNQLVNSRKSIPELSKIYHKRAQYIRNELYSAYGKSTIKAITKSIQIERMVKTNTGVKRGPRDPKIVEKIRQSNIETWKNNDEMKEKSRENMIKYCAPKSQSESARRKRVQTRKSNNDEWHTDEVKLKISKSWQNRIVSESTKSKMRIAAIDRISESAFNGGQVIPNYNPSSIPIIEAKARELGITDLQHAENGGEYHIEELGYWVDGYSKEKNIVIEYDEPHHKRQSEKDQIRQKEITEYLNCEFIRISQK